MACTRVRILPTAVYLPADATGPRYNEQFSHDLRPAHDELETMKNTTERDDDKKKKLINKHETRDPFSRSVARAHTRPILL